jgi:hypothetical protein
VEELDAEILRRMSTSPFKNAFGLRIWISMASGCPSAEVFGKVFRNLENVAPRR